jgi:outer membrane protein TolC
VGQIGTAVVTQTPTPGAPGTVTTVVNSVIPQGTFSGSVPESQTPGGALQISLQDAITRGLRTNLGALTSSQAVRQAQGQRSVALSALLPNVNGRVSETLQRLNLAAFGFHLPGTPSVVGPFSYFDARAAGGFNIVDITSLRNYRAAQENIRSAEHAQQDARDIIALVVTGAYLQTITSAARIDASLAQVDAAQAIYRQAVDRHRAGVVARIDELRAQVQLQIEQQRLTSSRADFARQKLGLARLIGLPPGQDFSLSDTIPFVPLEAITVEDALKRAMTNRADLQTAESQVRAADLARSAARAEYLPSLAVTADFGILGPRFNDTAATYSVVGALHIPIFQGGRVRGDIEQADAALQQRRAELAGLRGRVDYEVRTSFIDVQAAADQVAAARSNVGLATETLTHAQDRFRAGVADTVEVVQAQERVATANEDYIIALYSHNVAKAALARAMGLAEETLKQYLRGK